MKFYHPTVTDCSIVDYITSKDWSFANSKQAIDFYTEMNKFNIKHIAPDYQNQIPTKHRQYCIDNFDKLQDIDRINTHPHEHNNAIQDQNLAVSYIDRGKPKTIVAVSGGSWLLQLTRNSIEHQLSWMLDHYTDYNVISIVDDVRRSHRNPVLYDSCMYKGINDYLDSPEKLANYIKQLIPNTEYNVIADCKNGHSSCMLAYHLNATRVLVLSGTTTCDPTVVFNDPFYAPVNDRHNMLNFFQSPFEVALRNIAFCKYIPDKLISINSIATAMPNTEFTYVFHVDDAGFKLYRDELDTSLPNINIRGIKSSPYTFGNHYITLELRKSGQLDLYFS
jgi:hypothetical protein